MTTTTTTTTTTLEDVAGFLRGIQHYVENLADTADELTAAAAAGYTVNESHDLEAWVRGDAADLAALFSPCGFAEVERMAARPAFVEALTTPPAVDPRSAPLVEHPSRPRTWVRPAHLAS